MMPASVAPRSPVLLTDRRTLLGGFVVTGLLTVHHPQRTCAQEGTPSALSVFAGETFVGETSDPQTLVALVLGEDGGSAPRPARAYLCNGLLRTIDVWLTGDVVGDQLTLAAEDGSQLRGVINPAGIGGGATLGNGTSLLFTALPAAGIAGLYTVAMLADGRMEGNSSTGATLVGTVTEDEVPAGTRFSYVVEVTPPTADAIPLTITTATTEDGEFRAIVLPNGEGQGQGKTRKSQDWTDPEPQPAHSSAADGAWASGAVTRVGSARVSSRLISTTCLKHHPIQDKPRADNRHCAHNSS